MKKLIFILAILLFSCPSFAATTYYIDYAGGADTNNGTAKETPFKRAPGMVGCANTCASTTPAAGDSFIFKGGVTWPNATMGWLWTWSGNATDTSPGCTGTGCIYIGVDVTWYTGGAWARPILDAEDSEVATVDSIPNTMFRMYANYTIFDNFEFKGFYWSGDYSPYNPGMIQHGAGTDVEYKNLYLHDWSHGGVNDTGAGLSGGGNTNTNTILHSSVIDGSDTADVGSGVTSLAALYGNAVQYVDKNYIAYTTQGGIVNYPVRWNGNTIAHIGPSFDAGAHRNGLEVNASYDFVMSNNLMYDMGTGTLTIWMAPHETYTAYVINNVFYDTDVNNVLDVASPVYTVGQCTDDPADQYCTIAGTVIFYNNTVECGPDSNPNTYCSGIDARLTAVSFINNHFITDATTPNSGIYSYSGEGTITNTTNLVQTKAVANGQGYTSAQTYPFYPTDGADGTVGAGTDLTASCSSPIAGLCSSAGVGVLYNATSHTVTYPILTQETRPDGSAWDIGAYQLGGASTYTLTVTKVGTGTVISNVPGIDCGSTCANVYDAATEVTLTASYADNQKVTWGGADGGGCSGDTCTVTMSAARAVTATFSNLTGQGTIGGTGGATIGGSGGATIQR